MAAEAREVNVREGRSASFGLRVSGDGVLESWASVQGSPAGVASLLDTAVAGELGGTRLRSLAWKAFLGVVPLDAPASTWPAVLADKRAEYGRLLRKHQAALETPTDDPLLDADGRWEQLRLTQELVESIQLDCQRLLPDGVVETFFQDTRINTCMVNVLYLWSCLHPGKSHTAPRRAWSSTWSGRAVPGSVGVFHVR